MREYNIIYLEIIHKRDDYCTWDMHTSGHEYHARTGAESAPKVTTRGHKKYFDPNLTTIARVIHPPQSVQSNKIMVVMLVV